MSERWLVTPEVAGGLGEHTQIDTSTHPPIVSHLHYEFQGWLGDDLLESFPCFVVSERLAIAIAESGLTGWNLAPLEVTKGDEFGEFFPDLELPTFFWLQVSGRTGDFALAADHRLEVSEGALELLKRFVIANAIIMPK